VHSRRGFLRHALQVGCDVPPLARVGLQSVYHHRHEVLHLALLVAGVWQLIGGFEELFLFGSFQDEKCGVSTIVHN